VRFLITAFCLSLAALAPAHAEDPYTVTGVEIDATADNALQAQTRAMRQGQRVAARLLVERLTLAEDRVGTPLETEAADAFAIDDAIIAEMISGLEIRDEQRSSTRYLAKLDVGFHRRSVERVLDAYDIPFVDSQARPTLVLPVMEQGGALLLWEDNPWREAWQTRRFRHALTPMFMPDIAPEEAPISARQALQLNEAALQALAADYGVRRIAILRAGERSGGYRVGGYLVELATDGTVAVDTWGPETLYGGWQMAARTFVTRREDEWKRASVVRDREETEMRVTVLYGGIDEWRRLQAALGRASLVRNAQLDALSRDGARMTVHYRGAVEQLVSELAERGATLEEHPELGWVVMSTR
jgi:hypothetical protein